MAAQSSTTTKPSTVLNNKVNAAEKKVLAEGLELLSSGVMSLPSVVDWLHFQAIKLEKMRAGVKA